MTNTFKKIPVSCLLFWLMLLAVGGFHPWLNCLLAALLLGILIWESKTEKQRVVLPLHIGDLFALTLPLFYLLATPFGVEIGSALQGVLNCLPVGLYLVLVRKQKGEQQVLEALPHALAVGTLLSLVGMALPVVNSYFTVAGRLGGFLQYPNTFGLLLLVGELLLVTKENSWKPVDFAALLVLVLGIFLTGSRTVFVLFLVGNFGAVFFVQNKKIKWSILALVPLGIGLAVFICALTGNMDVITRYLSLSVLESTFLGRILYAYDALPVILSHPLGLGFKGYAYLQSTFQSGWYSVAYVHNDFLQILLDVGWVPFLFFGYVVGKTLFSKQVAGKHKWIFLMMSAHALLDFDFQYMGVFALYLLFTPVLKKPILMKKPNFGRVVAGALAAVCLYFGCALGIGFFGGAQISFAMLPFTSQGALATLQPNATYEQQVALGQSMVTHNPNLMLGYQLLGDAALSQGDMESAMAYYTKGLDLAPLNTDLYQAYAYRLATAVQTYRNAGHRDSANLCLAQLKGLLPRLENAQSRMSELGKRINDQPAFAESAAYISQLIDTLE